MSQGQEHVDQNVIRGTLDGKCSVFYSTDTQSQTNGKYVVTGRTSGIVNARIVPKVVRPTDINSK